LKLGIKKGIRLGTAPEPGSIAAPFRVLAKMQGEGLIASRAK